MREEQRGSPALSVRFYGTVEGPEVAIAVVFNGLLIRKALD